MDTGTPDELPWWAQTRARLALLLLILILGGGGTLLAASALRSASADDGCWIRQGPAPIWLRPAVVRGAVRRLGLLSVAPPGTVTVRGLSPSDAAWTDAPPRGMGSGPSFVPAGYEVRWRTPSGDRFGVAAYRFADYAAASEYVADARSTLCRTGTSAEAASAPPASALLTRRDVHGDNQVDLFFARGATGYRLFETPVAGARGAPRASRLLSGLACRLTEARCAGRAGG